VARGGNLPFDCLMVKAIAGEGAAILAALRAIGSATDAYGRAVVAESGLGGADLASLATFAKINAALAELAADPLRLR
jgi:hypothetical protein